MAEDITDRAAGILANKIRAGKLDNNFTAREVQRKSWELLTEKEVVNGAIQDLVEANWLREIKFTITKKGGRAKVEYEINPQIKKEGNP